MYLEKIDFSEINKFLVVGFDDITLEKTSLYLTQLGLSPANASKREEMRPREISKTILGSKKSKKSETPFKQKKVSKAWGALAMDLFMGNLEHQQWFWTDREALPLLKFWKKVDGELAFIMLYDTPTAYVKRYIDTQNSFDLTDVNAKLDAWCDYNEAMLQFFYKNQKKAIMLHEEVLKNSSLEQLQFLEEKVGLPFLTQEVSASIQANDSAIVAVIGSDKAQEDASFEYLVHDLLENRLDVQELYQELQAVANMPSQQMLQPQKRVEDALSALVTLRGVQKETLQSLTHKEQTLEEVEAVLAQQKNVLVEKETQLQGLLDEQSQTKQESDLLLSQLPDCQQADFHH